MPGVRQAKAAETEAALKAAAKEVFAERGYLNTKITDITAAAGRAAGSFYNHFAGKEELLQALLADLLAETDVAVEADSEHDQDFTARAAIRYHVAFYFRFFRANRTVMVALYQAAMVDRSFAATLNELSAPDIGHMAEHLDHVQRTGHELPGEPLAVARAIGTLLWGFAHALLVERSLGDLTEEAAVDLVTDLIHRGVAGRV
ncbi:MAG: TetR family transcriptional regulator [Actinophytocola sp.]|uniref:TetR/AcrR family transcriptional regulator n=1 Tax=Actinophytocola sp. TaxID=1872138 RepID=UPI001328205D|nr:TetR/AcrR family transcriptional regulator [Actinophytocola sp.]MPZ83578.1 TetR family transcriptional regulator [Actinophytocola sp.]